MPTPLQINKPARLNVDLAAHYSTDEGVSKKWTKGTVVHVINEYPLTDNPHAVQCEVRFPDGEIAFVHKHKLEISNG